MLLRTSVLRGHFSRRHIDYFDILQVDTAASVKDIKRAFQRETKLWHPDLNQGNEARFKLIREAYETLIDPRKSTLHFRFKMSLSEIENFFQGEFDTTNFNLFWEYHGGYEDDEDMLSFFKNYFANFEDIYADHQPRAPAAPKKSGYNISQPMAITLKEALRGGSQTLKYQALRRCSGCNGSGWRSNNSKKKHTNCSICYGDFKTNFQLANMNVVVECLAEKLHVCSSCNGDGLVLAERQCSVEFPRGVSDGAVLTVPKMGGFLNPNGLAGDLEVLVEVQQHNQLTQRGNDLILVKEISPVQAYYGGRVDVVIFDRKMNVELPKLEEWEDQAVFERIVKGEGFLDPGSKSFGDLVIQFKIKLPVPKNTEILNLYYQLVEGENEGSNSENCQSGLSDNDKYLNSLADLWGK